MTERERTTDRINCVSMTTFVTVLLAMGTFSGTSLGFAYSILDARISEIREEANVVERDVKDFTEEITAIRVEIATLRVVNQNILTVLGELKASMANNQRTLP